jgi:uncharacterized LabA/DUF88 family protein
MNRVSFIVDGFNLYHSVREAAKDIESLGGLKVSTKWLNIKKLCSLYLPHIHGVVKEKTMLGKIYYFSAFAYHIETYDPDVVNRHKKFIKCLEDTGVSVEISRFKQKEINCNAERGCRKKFFKYEEKETDVAIAVKLLKIFFNDECDTVVIVTGDTDIAPAVTTSKRLFPTKNIIFAFPYKRKNKELSQLAPGSFKIKSEQYVKNQFSDPIDYLMAT